MRCSQFFRDETGAISADWIALVSAILVLGIVVVYSVHNIGVSSVERQINSTLAGIQIASQTGASAGSPPASGVTFTPPVDDASVGSAALQDPVLSGRAARKHGVGEADDD